jgi:hypothetical protein
MYDVVFIWQIFQKNFNMSYTHTFRKLVLLQRISHNKIDLLQLDINDCLGHINYLEHERSNLIAAHEQEEAFAAKGDASHCTQTLAVYRENHEQKIALNTKSREQQEKRYKSLQNELRELFAEQKAYEISIDRIKKQQTDLQQQIELTFMDEVSSQKWYKRR